VLVAHACNPTQEAEIRRIKVQRQPGQVVLETLSQKNQSQVTGGVAQGVGPEFKPQYHTHKKKCSYFLMFTILHLPDILPFNSRAKTFLPQRSANK
jgi:hypothetical protein